MKNGFTVVALFQQSNIQQTDVANFIASQNDSQKFPAVRFGHACAGRNIGASGPDV
jgi:hypothetical protein